MQENIKNPNISNSEYEELIAKSIDLNKKKEKSIVDGKIVAIENETVIVDVGLKSEGRIPLSEFSRPGKDPEIKIGDSLKFFIDRVDGPNGETSLSREKAIKQAAWNNLQDNFNNNKVVTGVPFNKVKGGMSVDLDGVTAFLPGSQIDNRQIINDTKEILNKPIELMILKMDKYRGNIVVSRKVISDNQLKEQRKKILSNISEGSTLDGKVKNITDYGVFVDLGGIDGLVHITDISWKKVNHPSDFLKIGDDIKVKVLKYDEEITRLSLGIKQLTDDPWEEVNKKFELEKIYDGEVSSINDQGISISIDSQFDGFIQISELSWLKKPPHPNKIVQLNDKLSVKLVEINSDKRKLFFSLKQLKPNPWDQISNKFKVGDKIETEIVNKVDFGIFVKVFDEIDGMVHVSDLSWNEEDCSKILSEYSKGNKISVKILDIDTVKERISLSVKHLADDPIDEYIKQNPVNTVVSGQIKSIDEKGVTVSISEKIIGFIKKSNLAKDKMEQKIDRFAIDEKIDSMIISYDQKARRINLSIKDMEILEEKKVLSKYGSNDSGALLGDILSNALENKKSE
tara:strand:- start:13074 stop:14783 length:1710 start_codon:yes stop_codon:yes gene_type:complete